MNPDARPEPDTDPVGGTPRRPRTDGRDPSRAIAAKKQQATANREKIAAVITALQRDGRPVNVQSVARAAGVHPHTVRRNPDLLKEVRHLRERGPHQPPVTGVDPAATAAYTALKGRLLASQSEVADLRRELAQLRRDAHQALGTATARPEPAVLDDLRRQVAELQVQLMNERDAGNALRAAVTATAEDLTATRQVARGYLRELNQTRDQLQQARQELVKRRSRTSSQPGTGDRSR